jgi:hypothetical protein
VKAALGEMASDLIFIKNSKNYAEDRFSQALPWFNAIMPGSKMTPKMTRKSPPK